MKKNKLEHKLEVVKDLSLFEKILDRSVENQSGTNIRLLNKFLARAYFNNKEGLKELFEHENELMKGIATSAYHLITGDIKPCQTVEFGGLGAIIKKSEEGLKFNQRQLNFAEISERALKKSINSDLALFCTFNSDLALEESINSGRALIQSTNSGTTLHKSINSGSALYSSNNLDDALLSSINLDCSLGDSINSDSVLNFSVNRGESLRGSLNRGYVLMDSINSDKALKDSLNIEHVLLESICQHTTLENSTFSGEAFYLATIDLMTLVSLRKIKPEDVEKEYSFEPFWRS